MPLSGCSWAEVGLADDGKTMATPDRVVGSANIPLHYASRVGLAKVSK
jgi:hypothetical protein